MILWEYDGSFEGFLSLVHKSYALKTIPDTITRSQNSGTLLDESIWIETDPFNSEKVAASLQKYFSKEAIERLMHAFLCDDVNPERDILLYIRIGFKSAEYLNDLAHPTIYAIHGYQRRVLSTLHKMNAYLRFEELEDKTLYAKIEPPRNVLPLMGAHFCKRLRGEPFIIHDRLRSLALWFREGEMKIESVEGYTNPESSPNEKKFRHLWKTFFDHVAIESRKNPSLQRSHVPLKYRIYMSEFFISP
ncbi:MAG: TIGR03915 family putative DNA repair protein [Sulfuricurvum sp.]|uniref:TIGR03915 family putative DNA repair protein n=1 Tax=Sulfuricurvum sp. TaxID=2025608 RepID=UPI0025F56489|nr:TIGR03915 family putative DNA repair protein [Sulfuricurvum sp.]MBV5320673.1 TIGR03915 family putative DNA repair protein [Sulfuricurvum sp.]